MGRDEIDKLKVDVELGDDDEGLSTLPRVEVKCKN